MDSKVLIDIWMVKWWCWRRHMEMLANLLQSCLYTVESLSAIVLESSQVARNYG